MKIIASLTFLAAVVYVLGNATNNEYVVNEALRKEYKLMYKAEVWSTAKATCESEGARLAVPRSQAEFEFLQGIVRGMQYKKVTGTTFKLLVFLGINNIEDYRVWKNLDGENIENSGYHQWSGSNGEGFSDNPAEPHCGGMDAANPGLRDWWCHRPQPYICEKAL